ncbi:methionine ABC transporter ATP-binding protein [Paenibacillus daejeonensis]|uniref:methionine ABC transporter ATP-binding protein n=1 Tax=Paenibacillus daejeonensis TaxID=135193 RepID=UPI0004780447|nr:ATP-binding cassette domain-containing protein [Paenibacillus daejeonensis]
MIELRGVAKTYETAATTVDALSDVNLTVEKGEIFGIIGHSGAGKSTLLRCVNLLERPSLGSVSVGGHELTILSEKELQQRRQKIGMIFQHFNLLSTATVRDNIAFPLKMSTLSKEKVRRRVDELLDLVGLRGHEQSYPAQLSGGQKQRVGIARALANHPDVLLCDEATSALDPHTTESILTLLKDINQKLGITILLITHEMNVIRSICDRVAVMEGGRIIELGEVLEVFLNPHHKTTRDFVSQVAETVDVQAQGLRPEGVVVRINYQGDLAHEPILFETVKGTEASFVILQGTVSRMKDTPYGQLIVELRGNSRDTSQIIEQLRHRGLDVSVL